MSSVSAVPGIDATAVEDWICQLDPGASPPFTLTRLGRGKSNVTVLVQDVRTRRWVLRRPPFGEVAASAHDVMREQSIMSRLIGTCVPVPRVLGATTDRAVSDAPLVLLEYVNGKTLDGQDAVNVVPLLLRHGLGIALVRALAAIHNVNLVAAGLQELASHDRYAPRQIRRWYRQWNAVRTRDAPLVERLADELLDRAPDEPEVTLVHGDYHLQNVILDPGWTEVSAVLDWELSTLGHPLADLGTLLAYWPRSANDPVAELMDLTLPRGFPSDDDLISAYRDASGREVDSVRYWQALGYWKIAIIGEGVRRRSIDEPLNGEPLPTDLIDALLERALTLVASGLCDCSQ